MMNPQAAAPQIPAHVPGHLVVDFDYIQPSVGGSIVDFWNAVQTDPAIPDIFFTPHQGGHWIMKRFDDIAHVFQNYADFSSIHEVIPIGSTEPHVPPTGMDPPQHTEYRRLLAPFFSPKSIENLEVRSRELTLQLMDRFRGATECEFIRDFSLTMPIGIFMSLVNAPEDDRLVLLDLSDRAVRSPTAEGRVQAYKELEHYLEKVFAERRENLGDDVLSALIKARVEGGQPMTHKQLIDCGSVLLAAGMDTVASMLGFIILFLAQNPNHRALLVANPDRLPQALEELMRLYSSANLGRVATRDLEYKGIAMKAGDAVLCSTSLAGIDPAHFSDPLTVDFDRADKRSLVFGKGPHQCIGAFLARTELRVFIGEWLKRVPDFRIKAGEAPQFASGPANGITSLPLEWDTPLA
jgi:cytochrome P450